MSSWNKASINLLVDSFLDGTLSETEWTHHAHLVVCTHHLLQYDHYDATLRIKLGIIKYNESIGLENTIDRGYHETMTLFWIWVVQSFLDKHDHLDRIKVIHKLLESPYSKKYLPFFYYSEDHIFSHHARATWVAPDVHPLDATLIETAYPKSIWYG